MEEEIQSPAELGLELLAEEDVTPEEWECFANVIEILLARQVKFLITGGIALRHYGGSRKPVKDLDLIIRRQDREVAVKALTDIGCVDYFDTEAYDRKWIYRAKSSDGIIIDLVWQQANQRYLDEETGGVIDDTHFARSLPAKFLGQSVRLVGPTDFCFYKIYVMHRGRCDWPDIFNVIVGAGHQIDWGLWLRLMGPDWRLLYAIIATYDWLYPLGRRQIPTEFREKLGRYLEANSDASELCKANRLYPIHWLMQVEPDRMTP